MLKKFFMNLLSSFVGAWIAIGLFCVTIVIVVVGLVAKAGISQGDSGESMTRHSVLTLDLNGEIEEREQPAELDYMSLVQGNVKAPQTLDRLVTAIREAKDNKDIDMIYLKCGGVSAAAATLHALRDELADFKKSGKRIYAYADSYGNGGYYLASVADSVFMNPDGALGLSGLSSTALYFKDLLDKVGVKMQVFKVGTYKSAVEPYLYNEMSAPARAQLDTLLGNIWGVLAQEISNSRNIKVEQINKMINVDFLPLQDGKFCEKSRLVDKVVYERTMDSRIAKAVGVDEDELNFVSPATLLGSTDWGMQYASKNQIAVLYACGEIMEGVKRGINCEVLVPIITKLADDDNVKGLVLRVNSPGGSVFGSTQIAEALGYFQSKGKPMAVSMGDYAASGGYWISCHADRIFADPTTITGSIGIFGMLPDVSGLASKIGVHPQSVSTNPEANFPLLTSPLTESQTAAMQSYIEKGYDRFITRVASGRRISPAKVRVIAEGRVWDGQKALELKLVDELGSLKDATEWVQKEVNKKGVKSAISQLIRSLKTISGTWCSSACSRRQESE